MRPYVDAWLPVTQRPFPNLFIVGTPRSGTTSVARWLAEHPDVAMGARKEPMHHAPDLPSPKSVMDRTSYLDLWDGTEDAIMRIDASPWYLLSKEAAASIAGDDPSARLVVHLRDPVEIIASLHAHHVFTGHETERDLERAVFAPRPADQHEFRRSVDYLETVRVARQLARFYEHFPRESVSFVDFTRMGDDPEGVYFTLLDDLGLRQIPLGSYPHLNRARHRRMPGVGRMFHGRASRPARGMRKVVAKLTVAQGRPATDRRLRSRIIEVIAPDIEELEALTGRDLGAWKATG